MINLKKLFWLPVVIVIAACGSNSEEEKLKKPVDLPKFEEKVKLKTVWSKNLGSGGDRPFGFIQPSLFGEAIYIAGSGGKVYKLDKKSGDQKWKTDLNETLISGVAYGESRLFVGSKSGQLIALNENDGVELWRIDVDGELVAPAVASRGMVFAQTASGLLLGINAETGQEVWRTFNSAPPLTVRGTATPVTIEGLVITGLANGKLIALDIETGIPRWDVRLAISSGDTDIERVVDVDVEPLLIGNRVLAGSYNGSLAMIDATSGQVYWQREAELRGDISEGFGNAYYASAQGEVLAYDVSNAKIKWVNESLLRRGLGDTATWINFVVVADYEGYLHVLSQRDGEIVGRLRIGDEIPRAPFIVSENKLYVFNNDGQLRVLKAEVSQ